MSRLTLSKHHGLGNDFLVYLDLDESRPLTAELARSLCDRHLGVGADGLIRVGRGRGGAAVSFELRNADGGEAEMSGNGMRCVAQAVVDAGVATGPELEVATVEGVRSVRIGHETAPGLRWASVDMGPAKVEPLGDGPVPQSAEVAIANPHLVLVDDGSAALDLEALGHQRPDHNVEIIRVVDRGHLAMRVWERGVGLTEACGTGSCAVAAAAVGWGLVDSPVVVHNPGGDLTVEVGETVVLSGPTQWVAMVEVETP
ncbi:MAG: diaminopimelate epimerase [Actinomycetota bacterium]|jgi:diaminopimelate epimerase|nr:diaminopimelate epimerase [Actinomycetota bacterium]